jgi:hypothetical protein
MALFRVNTSSRRRHGKTKWASSQHKSQAQKLESEWLEKQKEWAKMSPLYGKTAPKNTILNTGLSIPPGRTAKPINSVDTRVSHAPATPSKFYSGDKMLGVCTLHKSNAVPVFSSQEAIEISSMRR